MRIAARLVAIALVLTVGAASAAEYRVGDIEISAAWTRVTPKGAEVAGAYMTITNKGTTADRLVGGSSPVAKRFEIHSMTMDGGVMQMRPIADGLEIKPGATVEFKPQGFHVMMVGLTGQLQQGQHVKATLQFEHAGKVEIEYQVEGMGAAGPSMPMDHMDHGSQGH